MIVLYDLAGAEDRRFSPNCWRTQMALAHKGLAYETKPARFTDIAKIAGGSFKTVPVIEDKDRGRWVGDSWAIANYLEDSYPQSPSLFGGEQGRALTFFVQNWAIAVLHAGLIGMIVLDIHDQLDEADKPYFRTSREKRFGGRSLEDVQRGRESRIAEFRATLQPLRAMLAMQAWISGETPAYADYLVFGAFQWARIVSRFPILEKDDAVAQWFERMLDLYDGLGRSSKTV
jgi:glutathione S-transferase